MNLNFEKGVTLLKQCWMNDGRGVSPGKMAALNALRRHLNENGIAYSKEESLNWLDANKNLWNTQKFFRSRRSVYELDDVLQHGKINSGYEYHISLFDHIPDHWKTLLFDYEEDLLSRRKKRATNDQITHCTDFVSYLVSSGVNHPKEITVKTISEYRNYAETVGDKYICIYSVRFFLEFLVDGGLIPTHLPYALTAPLQAKAAGFALQAVDMDAITSANEIDSDIRMHSDSFWKKCFDLVGYLSKTYHYNPDGLRNNYLAHLQMFYIFAAELHLDYTPAVVACWFDVMRDSPEGAYTHSPRRRSFHVFEIFITTGRVSASELAAVMTNPGSESYLRSWAKSLLDTFLEVSKSEWLAENSINVRRSACISLLLYVQNQGISSPSAITPQTIKDYGNAVSSGTRDGKNNYRYAVGKFLLFLFENGYTRHNLELSLPSQCGQSRRIVNILTEDDINRIYAYRDVACTPIQLRDSAILMLGLLMGLRGIDIVNLKFCNIDWRMQTISITQQKTYRALVLPMPVFVGNSIYRYLKEGRPESKSDYIFLSHSIPCKEAGRSVCGDASLRALGEGRGSFHVFRRTFATRLLSKGAGTDMIRDTLGHATMNTVSRYLSLDEESVRSCCLPLNRTVEK